MGSAGTPMPGRPSARPRARDPGRRPQPLRFTPARQAAPGVAVLELAGALDERAIQSARQAMAAALAGRPQLILLSLAGVTKLDGAGLVLLAAMRQYAGRAGSQLSIVDKKGRVRGRPGLAATLPAYSSIATALRGWHQAARRRDLPAGAPADVAQGPRPAETFAPAPQPPGPGVLDPAAGTDREQP